MALLGILETAIGLAFIYLLLSMLCTGINEWVAQRRGRRGKFLRSGLVNIIPDEWMYLRLLAHPAMAALYRDFKGKVRHPSYVPSATFVTALADVVTAKASRIENRQVNDVREAAQICEAHGFPIGRTIGAIALGRNETETRTAIAAWYEGAMDRVSGWYKLGARRQLFLIGLIAAVALNVDSLAIAQQLLRADTLRAVLVEDAGNLVKQGLSQAQANPTPPAEAQLREQAARLLAYRDQGLRIGYACLDPAKIADPKVGLWPQLCACWRDAPGFSGTWIVKLLGWLITAFAVSQGGPFWFDLLNRLVSIRGAGAKPAAAKPAAA